MDQKIAQKAEELETDEISMPILKGHGLLPLEAIRREDDLETMLKRFPLCRITPSNIQLASKQNCGLCFRSYEEGDYIRMLPCNHKFHKNCLDPWLLWASPTCPTDNLCVTKKRVKKEVIPNVIKLNDLPIIPPAKIDKIKSETTFLSVSVPEKSAYKNIKQQKCSSKFSVFGSGVSNLEKCNKSVQKNNRPPKKNHSRVLVSGNWFKAGKPANRKGMKKEELSDFPYKDLKTRPLSSELKPIRGQQLFPQITKSQSTQEIKSSNSDKNYSSYIKKRNNNKDK